ncbi:toxin [Duganella sp. FT92W]|uniref:Toxin n=1 Tax=Pseudoduganella rivuli TaxID=2666085 RepID=A0A7X2ILY9_9BURK|nr:toxin [Pseudoduganella rivuli]MRV72289.1 toxin [Pseudoduganella rivuli]
MDATFIELPAFERHREDYLSDESFRQLQKMLLANPRAGDVIEGTGGLRKVRFLDWRRQKGKRGGIRVIYYWRLSEMQFLLFTLYDKDEASDLTSSQKKVLKGLLERELRERMLK